jgi:methyl-accepting chemotaxis protein
MTRKAGPKTTAAPAAAADAPPLQPQVVEPPLDDASEQSLRSWMSLAVMQQRVIRALVDEIARTSGFVETEADDLSGRFRRLAVSAQQQTARVDSLTRLAKGIELDGELVPIDAITKLLEGTLADVVAKILMLSKDSMSMVYALHELNSNVGRVDEAMVQLSTINRTTNMLAMNARIEAERAGEAGKTFRVVAQELRELSKATESVFVSMSGELKALTDGISSGHETLQRVATIDMSENMLARERLEKLLAALLQRGDQLETIVAEAVAEAGLISADVDGMVTGIQFQDRTKQSLEHVIDTMGVLNDAIEQTRADTAAAVPRLAEVDADPTWVKNLLDRFKLSEMRERFVAEILDGKTWEPAAKEDAAAMSGGSVELF